MKKLFIIILNFLLLQLYAYPALGQQLNLNNNVNLSSFLSRYATMYPQNLPRWFPFATEPAYLLNGTDPTSPSTIISPSQFTGDASSGFLGGNTALNASVLGFSIPLVIGGCIMALGINRGSNVVIPPIAGNLNPGINTFDPNASSYNFNFGENVLYSIVLKDSVQTPIYPDTVIYIKLPTWLEYIPSSTTINNEKLSDIADDDILIYFSDDSTLVLNFGNVNTQDGVIINFGAKVLTQTVAKHEAFCLIKFQSISQNYESDWKQLSVSSGTVLPPLLENIVKKH